MDKREEDARDELRELVTIDRVIHEPARLMIVAILYAVESADFQYLLRETGLSKGNLSAHLTKLGESGYIRINKTFRGRIPQTICSMTRAGRDAFDEYRAQLRRLAQRLPE